MKEEEQVRCWLYHGSCKEGKIFVGDEEVENAIKEGWLDSPAKVKKAGRPAKGDDKPNDDSK